MPNQHSAEDEMIYQIRVKGHLGPQWMDWFDGLTITLEENGESLLTGPVVDQAALHGILKKMRDLGMPLLSVNSVGPGLLVPPVTGATGQLRGACGLVDGR
jgi:hypothetical protein